MQRGLGGFTVLCTAADNRYEAMVQLLLERMVDIGAKVCYSETPLFGAALNEYEAMAQLLLGNENYN